MTVVAVDVSPDLPSDTVSTYVWIVPAGRLKTARAVFATSVPLSVVHRNVIASSSGSYDLEPSNTNFAPSVEVHSRAGDAIHTATALETGETEIWTNDRHLLAAVAHFGLAGRSA